MNSKIRVAIAVVLALVIIAVAVVIISYSNRNNIVIAETGTSMTIGNYTSNGWRTDSLPPTSSYPNTIYVDYYVFSVSYNFSLYGNLSIPDTPGIIIGIESYSVFEQSSKNVFMPNAYSESYSPSGSNASARINVTLANVFSLPLLHGKYVLIFESMGLMKDQRSVYVKSNIHPVEVTTFY
ncbi:hypothetical protein DMB44_03220 [Thermoplasma sp. Kam2015]|uniref:hypothetical protein n=1 Tax=Thermoplasma sp. Kam2015 TaxID=2094122 RepID=UPI000D92FE21|nr:hypothetical protein [Thermoplasma sp. Kam2015]PYB68631.1 hypothetical protein DMB44_03220 [Thermoplasma sp. Kam2015]